MKLTGYLASLLITAAAASPPTRRACSNVTMSINQVKLHVTNPAYLCKYWLGTSVEHIS